MALLARLDEASRRRVALTERLREVEEHRRLVEGQAAPIQALYDHGHETLESIDS